MDAGRRNDDGAATAQSAEERLPLPALLSQLLVALTIELDNEFEHRMPHRTTDHGATPGTRASPWLTSLVMWATCLRWVDEQGVSVAEMERRARTPTNLAGMQRWGYIVVAPDPADPRPKPPHADWVVRATSAGQMARRVWPPLFEIIEQRWRERFGADEIAQLRAALAAVVGQLDGDLPDCLPILGYGLRNDAVLRVAPRAAPAGGAVGRTVGSSAGDEAGRATGGTMGAKSGDTAGDLAGGAQPTLPALPALPALLAKVLLAFALEFERESVVSLAISADVLRLAGSEGVPVQQLPRLAGVSKETVSMALQWLTKQGYAVVEPAAAGSHVKLLRLTAKGRQARATYDRLLGEIERRWQERYGRQTVSQLRAALECVVGDVSLAGPLLRGLEPYPDGWRAAVRRPERLPHFPMVLHRGGYPDGS